MATELVSFRTRLSAAERSMREQRAALYDAVRQDPDFQRENITLYDFDTLDNIEVILGLLDGQAAPHLEDLPNRTMIDIGCANGDLGLTFEDAGFSVALLDRSHVAEVEGSYIRQNAPLVASIMARTKGSRAAVFDEDIDDGFDPRRVVDAFAGSTQTGPAFERFDLGVMLGVLYHLKNPYSVIEKLGRLCDHLILGTWVADCLPGRVKNIEGDQVAFLLEDRQLAVDPTNFWIFTPRSLRVLVVRCGWEILEEHTVVNPNEAKPRGRLARLLARSAPAAGVSPPDDVKRRDFLLLRRRGT